MRAVAVRNLMIGFCLVGMAGAALGQDETTRGVRIIEGAPTPALAPVTAPPIPVDVRQTAIRTENTAGVQLAIMPDVELAAGTKVVFRVATRASGYLVLVDVDPTGKLTQIYPNRHSLQVMESPEALNLLNPGQAVTIPNQSNPFAGFEFVVAPPVGVGMVIAMLSDRPVHMLDLPDLTPPQAGQAAFDQLTEAARRLRIVREDGPGGLQEPKWSFDAKLYLIR